MHVHIQIHTCIHIMYIYKYIYMCMYIYIYAYICAGRFVFHTTYCTYRCIYIYTHHIHYIYTYGRSNPHDVINKLANCSMTYSFVLVQVHKAIGKNLCAGISLYVHIHVDAPQLRLPKGLL